jgi:hypothetical protein
MSSSSIAREDPTAAAESTTQTNSKGTRSSTPVIADAPTNPALEEPDAMAIVQKGHITTSSVGSDRKQQLLVQARAERRKWVQTVPLPYATARDPNDVWSTQDQLHPFQSSVACKRVPAVTKVLSELYGLENHTRTPEEVAQRVDSLVRTKR